jgi:uncharacterized membrane protein YhaH (DUF805 family)
LLGVLGIYFWPGLFVLNTSLNIRAFVRCLDERFHLGVIAGAVRALVVVLLTALLLWGYFPRLGGGLPWWVGRAILPLAVAQPLLALPVLALAYRRMHDAPAAMEQHASRPFDAWLPIGILDAILVVMIPLFTGLIASA